MIIYEAMMVSRYFSEADNVPPTKVPLPDAWISRPQIRLFRQPRWLVEESVPPHHLYWLADNRDPNIPPVSQNAERLSTRALTILKPFFLFVFLRLWNSILTRRIQHSRAFQYWQELRTHHLSLD